MARTAKWVVILCILPSLLVISTENTLRAEQELFAEDFPCETLPPKCPDTYSKFLTRLKALVPSFSLRIRLDEKIPVEHDDKCTDLYLIAGSTITIKIKEVLSGEMRMIRNPSDPKYGSYPDDLYFWTELGGIILEDVKIGVGGRCRRLLFPNLYNTFQLYIRLNEIKVNTIGLYSMTSVWEDDTEHVDLRYSPTGYSDTELNMYIELLDPDNLAIISALVNGVINLIFTGVSNLFIEPALNTMLLSEEEGLVLDLVEMIMDELYQLQPVSCGGCGGMIPSSTSFASRTQLSTHVAANVMTYLLPFGLIFFYKRKRKK